MLSSRWRCLACSIMSAIAFKTFDTTFLDSQSEVRMGFDPRCCRIKSGAANPTLDFLTCRKSFLELYFEKIFIPSLVDTSPEVDTILRWVVDHPRSSSNIQAF